MIRVPGLRFSMERKVKQKQIPYGNDRKKSKTEPGGSSGLSSGASRLRDRPSVLASFIGISFALCEDRFAGCTQPNGDCLRSRIRIADHAIPKIARPPQTGFHPGRRFGAAFRCFDCGLDCFA